MSSIGESPDPDTAREWGVHRVVRSGDTRTVEEFDRTDTAGHRAIRVVRPFLRIIKNSTGNLSAANASDALRLLAEVELALISVALHQDNEEDDPLVSI